MHFVYTCLILLIVTSIKMIVGSTTANNNTEKVLTRNTRAIDENFKILLELYKMNPLKRSKIYEVFSRNLLMTNMITNQNATSKINSENNEKKQKEIGVKFGKIFSTIHKEKDSIEYNSSEVKFHLSDSKEELFEPKPEILNKAVKVVKNVLITTKTNDNIFNYISENIESEEINRLSSKFEKFAQKATTPPIVTVPIVISMPGGNEIEGTRTNSMGGKVESNDVFEDNDNNIIILK